MKILNGKKIADVILSDLQKKIVSENLHPGLGVILVGRDEASKIYVDLKEKAAKMVGIYFKKLELPEDFLEEEVLQNVEALNADPEINGIIVQLPLPAHLDKNKIISAIDPKKDVDGFHPENIKLFFEGRLRFLPVFPEAILELIKFSGEKLKNKNAIIICNSQEFGRTMQVALSKENIFSKYIFKEDISENLSELKNTDIIITACGEPDLINGKMIKDGIIVIDGGITQVDDKVVGDVDFESVKNKEGYLSPVPGGVGPVTIACLLRNVVEANKKSL